MEKLEISFNEFMPEESVEVTNISSKILFTEKRHSLIFHTVFIDMKSLSLGTRFFHFKTGEDQEWKIRLDAEIPRNWEYYNIKFGLCLTNFPKYSPVKTLTSLYGLRNESMFANFLPLDVKGCKINELNSLPNSLKIKIHVLEKVECNDVETEIIKPAIEGTDSPDHVEILFNKDQDVILFSVPWVYRCHKEVLANSSPVFKAMFNHDLAENKSGRVMIGDIEGPVVQSMLLYIYTGSCVGLEKYADKLVYAANKYELKTLETACINYMVQNIVPDNALKMLDIADLCDNEFLRDTAMRFIQLNFGKVVLTDGWKKLEKSHKLLCKLFKMLPSSSDDKQKSTVH